MKAEKFVNKDDELLFYIQKIFFMMINTRKLEQRRKEILDRLSPSPPTKTLFPTGTAFLPAVVAATTSHPRCLQFPVDSDYQSDFLRFFASLVEDADDAAQLLAALTAVGSKPAPQTDDPFEMRRRQDCYKTHILSNGRHPVTVFESADAVDETFATTGLSTWTASIVLNDWIVLNPEVFSGKRVVELGCGVGLTGLVTIVECGPASYVFTDYHHKVLSRCEEHIELNLRLVSPSLRSKTRIQTKRLDWVDFDPRDSRFAWMADPVDVIIGSDIIYHPSIIPPLVRVLKYLLTPRRRDDAVSKPKAIFSAAVRKPSTFDYFLLCLKNSSLLVEDVPEEALWDCGDRTFFNFSDCDAPFRILTIVDASSDEEIELFCGS